MLTTSHFPCPQMPGNKHAATSNAMLYQENFELRLVEVLHHKLNQSTASSNMKRRLNCSSPDVLAEITGVIELGAGAGDFAAQSRFKVPDISHALHCEQRLRNSSI